MTSTRTSTRPRGRLLGARGSQVGTGSTLRTANDDLAMEWQRMAQAYPRATHEETLALLAAAQGLGGEDARARQAAEARLVEANLRLVLYVAVRYATPAISLNALLSAAQEALLGAIRAFDVTRDNQFATYAIWRLRAACARAMHHERELVHVPDGQRVALETLERRGALTALQARATTPETLAAAQAALDAQPLSLSLGVFSETHNAGRREPSLADTLADPTTLSLEEQVVSRQSAEWLLAQARAALDPRSYAIFVGMTVEEPAPSVNALAARHGISRVHLRTLYNAACHQVRGYLHGNPAARERAARAQAKAQTQAREAQAATAMLDAPDARGDADNVDNVDNEGDAA